MFVRRARMMACESRIANRSGDTSAGRVARFESTLDVLRRLLAGEEVTTDNPLPLRAARSGPLPPEPVDVWIGASAPPAIDRAASRR